MDWGRQVAPKRPYTAATLTIFAICWALAMARASVEYTGAGKPQLRADCTVLNPISRSPRAVIGSMKNEDVYFDSLNFSLKMDNGDFVFLPPARYEKNEKLLGGAFFNLTADFVLPAATHDSGKQSTGDKPTFVLKKNVPLIRMYLIVYAGTKS